MKYVLTKYSLTTALVLSATSLYCMPSLADITHMIQTSISSAESLPLRLLSVLLLGLLMSLTPCIYPMVPITVGILQQQAGQSIIYNFFNAALYAMGLATTFAALGLAAALGGQVFGLLLSHPIFIVGLIALLIYFGLSMFDWYEIRMPQFLQASPMMERRNIFAPFIFGLLSGSIASPCLSPGLAFLLTIVATLGNLMTGFLMLFSFGIGLSIPLLIIGTFSSSLTVLPRAGAWMIEVKKVFGFIILALCFYYAKNILPLHVVLAAFAVYVAGIGMYYITHGFYARTAIARFAAIIAGTVLLGGSVSVAREAFISYLYINEPAMITWNTDYDLARQQAIAQNKPLFIDIWGKACSICTAIDTKIMHDATVAAYINTTTIPVKLEATSSNSAYMHLKQMFGIVGVPTFLLIDPVNETLIARWSGELYEMTPAQFVAIVASKHRK